MTAEALATAALRSRGYLRYWVRWRTGVSAEGLEEGVGEAHFWTLSLDAVLTFVEQHKARVVGIALCPQPMCGGKDFTYRAKERG